MLEQPIELISKDIRLSGTACLPSAPGRFPVVLMIHGSGPLDRDENIRGQRLDVFNTIAHHLATIGIASVRYDKRGCGASQGNYISSGHFDLVADAVNWVDALPRHDFCFPEHIYLLGHSEGALLAPQVSLKRSTVAGILLLCPFLDKLEAVLIKQAIQGERDLDAMRGLPGVINRGLARIVGRPLETQHKLIAQLKGSSTDTIRFMLRKLEAKWFRELLGLDPGDIYRQLTCPMFILGGEKDIQCDPADVAAIAALAKGDVTTHVVKDLTHILRCDAGKPSFLGYRHLLKKPVEPIVLALIEQWLKRHALLAT